MKNSLFSLFISLSLLTFSGLSWSLDTGSGNTPATSEELVDLFSAEQNPGEGTLEYKTDTETEKIIFGKDSGIFGLAMTFKGRLLPDQYQKDFRKNFIIQIAMGTLKSKLGNKLPQFGAATLITNMIPTEPTSFEFIVPDDKPTSNQKNKKNTAFLIFTSPNTKANQSDEEKLKSSFFAKKGKLNVIPLDTPRLITVKNAGTKVSFKMQMMRIEMETSLATPFTGNERILKGGITFPFYWPYGKEAETLARKIAGGSLPGGKTSPERNTAGGGK